MVDTQNLWPTPEYQQQVERLRTAIGQPSYLVEIDTTEITVNAGITPA